MYAIIRTGGKQHRVEEGDKVRVESLGVDVDQKVDFDEVLAVHDGTDLKLGHPLVDSAKVQARVVDNARGRKIIVFKKKRRKGYHKKNGHRQNYTEVVIESISAG